MEEGCGVPAAIDAIDVIYWACNGGVQATTPSGAVVGGWSANFSFGIALGPDGSAYFIPAASDHVMLRIK